MSEDKSGSIAEDMSFRQAEAYRAAAGILLSDERARGEIKDVILYSGERGIPKLAVVHRAPMHDNFFIEGEDKTYDCHGFVGEVIERASQDLPSQVRTARLDVGCVVSSLIEEVPHELDTARAGQSEAMFRAFLAGKAFNLETGQFDVSAAQRYPVTAQALTDAFRSGWDFYN